MTLLDASSNEFVSTLNETQTPIAPTVAPTVAPTAASAVTSPVTVTTTSGVVSDTVSGAVSGLISPALSSEISSPALSGEISSAVSSAVSRGMANTMPMVQQRACQRFEFPNCEYLPQLEPLTVLHTAPFSSAASRSTARSTPLAAPGSPFVSVNLETPDRDGGTHSAAQQTGADAAASARSTSHSSPSASSQSPRQIIVGDVHGHYDTLLRLLEAVNPSSTDRVDFLGDLIDRGPNSRAVVALVMNTPNYRTIRGNHEEMAIAAFTKDAETALRQSWLNSGGHQTLQSYYRRAELREHLEWLQHQPMYRDLGEYWLVHAGIDPQRPIAAQTSREFCWIRDSFHRSPEPYFPDKLTIVGHTISFTFLGVQPGQLARGVGWLDIDTGAYTLESGWLTAIDLTQERVYQTNSWTRETRVLSFDVAIADIDPQRVRPRRFVVK